MTSETQCGFVAIVGRTNVGKSTLFNNILKKQLSITTHKPQTTRHNIQGVLSLGTCQLVLVDTPGIQLGSRRLMSKALARNALSCLQDADIILMLIELGSWREEDEYLLQQIKQVSCPVVLVINKIDKLKDKSTLLPILDKIKILHNFISIIPLSALYDKSMDVLITELCRCSPKAEFLFSRDIKWDRDDLFVITEVVREAAMLQLQKELPYAIYTEVEEFNFDKKLATISVIIWVEKESQKPIVIGKKGSKLKMIGEQTRIKLEKIFNRKVMLKLWVKVKQNWQDRQEVVAQFEK